MPIFKSYLGRRDDEPLIRDQSGKYIQIDLENGAYCVLDPVRSHILDSKDYDDPKPISRDLRNKIQQILDAPTQIYFDAVEDFRELLEEYKNEFKERFSDPDAQKLARLMLCTDEYRHWFDSELKKQKVPIFKN